MRVHRSFAQLCGQRTQSASSWGRILLNTSTLRHSTDLLPSWCFCVHVYWLLEASCFSVIFSYIILLSPYLFSSFCLGFLYQTCSIGLSIHFHLLLPHSSCSFCFLLKVVIWCIALSFLAAGLSSLKLQKYINCSNNKYWNLVPIPMLEYFAARSDVLKQSSLETQFLYLCFLFYGVSTYLT